MRRRQFNGALVSLGAGMALNAPVLFAKKYLTVEQAKRLIWADLDMVPFEVKLSQVQMKSIKKASKTRVRHDVVKGLRAETGEYLIVDQVIGKHEFIDLAVGLDALGAVRGIEVLTYRESYGDEIMHPKWRAQFHGESHEQLGGEVLKLDEGIKNISGATLSCRHVTDGINRLMATWSLVLKNQTLEGQV